MKNAPIDSAWEAASVEMEEEEIDDNGLPSCCPSSQAPEESDDDPLKSVKSSKDSDEEGCLLPKAEEEEDGEDDNGVPSFIHEEDKDVEDLGSSTQEKHEDPGGTEQDGFSKQDSTRKLDEKQSAATSSGDYVSLDVEGQRNVVCEADQVGDQDAESSNNKTLESSNSSSQDEATKKLIMDELSVESVNRDVPKASSPFEEGTKDLTLAEKEEGSSRSPNDYTDARECIRRSETALDDQRGSEKTPDDGRKTLNIERSPIDSDKQETKTDKKQTEEDKEVDFFATDTGVPPDTIGTEDASSSGREKLTVPSEVRTAEFDPGPSRDDRKASTDLRNRESNARKTTIQPGVSSSSVGDGRSSERDGNNHSTKSAKVSNASTKLNFTTILAFLFSFNLSRGITALTVIPGDVLASSGSIARLRCSTNYPSPVYWERKLFGSDEQETIYYGKNGMARIAGDRIRIDENSTSGRYDLVISKVQLEDAGTYTCIDEAGIGEGYKAELVVSERLTCDMPVPPYGFMGENIFAIPEDPVVSTCSLTFRGNAVPRFQWTWGKVTPFVAPTIINASTVTSFLTLRATHDLDGARLTCLPILPTVATSTDDSLRWTSESLSVRYVHVMFGSVECQSNAMIPVCNPNCTYQVQQTSDNKCQCLAVYNDRGRTYSKVFNEHSCEIVPVSSSGPIIVVVAIVVTFAVIILTAGAIFILRHKYWRKTSGSREGKQKLKDPESDGSKESGSTENGSTESGSTDNEAKSLCGK